MRVRTVRIGLLVFLLALRVSAAERPALVVVLAVDQMRADFHRNTNPPSS